jgi:2-oxoglutarate dehydrogenase E2 component (dihydrolipoamide succinyltransferase)
MGESITEGTVVKWLKKVGETVQRDEPLLEISTDKVDAEIPAPAAGVVTEILAKEGDTVAINSVLARLGEAGEVGAGVSAAAAVAAAPAMGEVIPIREAPRHVEAPHAQADGDSRPLPSQAAPPQPPAQARAMPAAAPTPEAVGRARSSPLVRNIVPRTRREPR